MKTGLSQRIEISEIVTMFRLEFASLLDIFNDCIELTLDKAESFRSDACAKPGVYVFWKDGQVLKVGRHLENSRKRAVEHVNVPKEQKYPMSNFKNDSEAHLLLFNVKEHDVANGKDYRHWVAALEIFFELRLNPTVKSGRLG